MLDFITTTPQGDAIQWWEYIPLILGIIILLIVFMKIYEKNLKSMIITLLILIGIPVFSVLGAYAFIYILLDGMNLNVHPNHKIGFAFLPILLMSIVKAKVDLKKFLDSLVENDENSESRSEWPIKITLDNVDLLIDFATSTLALATAYGATVYNFCYKFKQDPGWLVPGSIYFMIGCLLLDRGYWKGFPKWIKIVTLLFGIFFLMFSILTSIP